MLSLLRLCVLSAFTAIGFVSAEEIGLKPFLIDHRAAGSASLTLATAQALKPADIKVSTTVSPSGAQLAAEVAVVEQPDGGRIIEVKLTNRSGADLMLAAAEVALPWPGGSGENLRVASGAMASGRWPATLLFEHPTKRDEPTSGMYLLAEARGEYALAAFVSWQTFWSKLHYADGVLRATADGEGRRIRAGETVALERIRLARGADWQDLLFGYAEAIRSELRLPDRKRPNYVGWSTWDYYGRDWAPDSTRGNVAALRRLVPQANLVQIDGGWWSFRGEFRPRTDIGPDGMKQLAAEFAAAGLDSGIHLDGMRASIHAPIAAEHPEYFLHDDHGELICELQGAGGDFPYYFYDFSHPGACEYMRQALAKLRYEWGYKYLKIDYLRAGIAEDVRLHVLKKGRNIVPHDPGLTSVERFRRGLAAFRAGMGDDAYFLGCSTPFGPALGFVDALRTGPDINPKYNAYQTHCQQNAGNFYLNSLIQVDADYEVVRAREDEDATMTKSPQKDGGDLTLNEAEMWTDYVALFSKIKLASDNLMILRPERKELVKFALTQPACDRFVPLDYWQHGRAPADAYEVFLGVAGREVFLAVFNWSGKPRNYRFDGVAAETWRDAAGVRGSAKMKGEGTAGVLTLAGRHSAIFRLPEGAEFDRVRKALRWEAAEAK